MSIEQQIKIIEYFIFTKDKIFNVIKTSRIQFGYKLIYIRNSGGVFVELRNGCLYSMNRFGGRSVVLFDSCLDFYNSYKEDQSYCFLSHGRTIPVLEDFLSWISTPAKEEMFDFIDRILSGEIKCI